MVFLRLVDTQIAHLEVEALLVQLLRLLLLDRVSQHGQLHAVTHLFLLEKVIGDHYQTRRLQDEEDNIRIEDELEAHFKAILAYVTATSHDEQEQDKSTDDEFVRHICRLNLIVVELVVRHFVPNDAHSVLQVEF